MKKLSAVLALFTAVQLTSGAFAACGGGGNKHAAAAAPAPAPASVAVDRDSTERAIEVRADRSNVDDATALQQPALNTDAFDAVSASLNLSNSQLRDIANAKSDIRNDLAKLWKNYDKALSSYQHCEGDCSHQYNKLQNNAGSLKAYDAYDKFESELSRILDRDQYHTYSRLAHPRKAAALTSSASEVAQH